MRILVFAVLLFLVPNNAWSYFCEDPKNPGQSVRIVEDTKIPNIGYAYDAPDGRATIRWNPLVAIEMGPDLAEFFRYHECAHIQENYYNFGVNHVYPPLKESRADCLAFIAMKSDGVLGKARFLRILDGLTRIQAQSTHTHFSGKKRALIIVDDCLLQNRLVQD